MFKSLNPFKSKSKSDEKEKSKDRAKSNKENRRPANQNQSNGFYHTNVPAKTSKGAKSELGGIRVDERKIAHRAYDLESYNPPQKRQRTTYAIDSDFLQRESTRHRSSRSRRAMSTYEGEEPTMSSRRNSDSTMEYDEDLDKTIGTRDGRRPGPEERYHIHVAYEKYEEYRNKYKSEKKFNLYKDQKIMELEEKLKRKEETIQERDRRIIDLEIRLQMQERQFGNVQQMSYPGYPPMVNYAGPMSFNHNNGVGYGFQVPTGRPSMYGMDIQQSHQYESNQRGPKESSSTPSSGKEYQPTNDLILARNMFGGNSKTDETKINEEKDEVRDFRNLQTSDSDSSIRTGLDDESHLSLKANALEEKTNALRI